MSDGQKKNQTDIALADILWVS